ncbi:hypothetical protein [Fictibacillus sp. NRS-1165]|uniref:hypothetical protein n=1 Tax=Fictibacillus sp. NRS-1165 TaxID=3144463 RepID=UPI003D1D47DA
MSHVYSKLIDAKNAKIFTTRKEKRGACAVLKTEILYPMDCIHLFSYIRYHLPPENIGRIPEMDFTSKSAISGLFFVEDITSSSVKTVNLSDGRVYKISLP